MKPILKRDSDAMGIGRLAADSADFADLIIAKKGVAVHPGKEVRHEKADFGQSEFH